MLSAVITVGSQFGSREQMARIKEKKSLLLERATTFDFAAWRAELVAPKDPPSKPEPFANVHEIAANINDQIRHRETGMEGPGSDDNDPPLGQAPPEHTANLHTFTTFETVSASPLSLTPPGGLSKVEEFITEDHETRLIDYLTNESWSKIGNREVCQFGYTYDFKKRTIKEWVDIPEELSEVVRLVADHRGNFPNSLIALRYTIPYHFNPHVDAPVFDGKIHSVALESGVVITFHNKENGRYGEYFPPRSLMSMQGDSRYTNTHCILPGANHVDKAGTIYPRFTRYALTFRYVPTMQRLHLP